MRWTEADFDAMSWHDNHAHALAIRAGEYGAGALELELDYILEWLKDADRRFKFRIAPAKIRFREVWNLKIKIDYEVATAALGPFSIHAIERSLVQRKGHSRLRWRILLNFPDGEITFEAAGYTQELTGPEIMSDRQYLAPAQRHAFP